MKNFFSIFSTENLKKNLLNIIGRFPVSVIIILIVNVLLLTDLHGNFTEIVSNNIIRLVFTFILTFFFSVGVYINSENHGLTKIQRNLSQIIPIIFGILFYIGFDSDIGNFENFILTALCSAGIASYLFFAPYIKNIIFKDLKQTIYYTYFYKISVIFLISAILGGILSALGSIGISAVFELFDLRGVLSDKIYQDWIILALTFFPPIYALTQIPEKETYNESHFNENIFFSFLVKYIAIPFIYIYFIILYAYTVKVLSNFGDWPKGEVSWMVIGFSTFGYIIYMFSYIFEGKNEFIKTFRTAFPYVVFPQLFMLFYAIYLRINQYDITVNRYFVVVFGIWLGVVSLYLVISKRKYLSCIPFILAIFTIIISIGPWSVYNFPEVRQLIRLKANLEKADILQNSEVTPLASFEEIDKDLSKNIYSGIDYLCDFDDCNSIKELFPEQYSELLKKDKEDWEERQQKDLEYYKNDEDMLIKVEKRIYNEPSKWEIVGGITKTIKVRTYYPGEEFNKQFIYIYLEGRNDVFPIDVNQYSKIYKIGNFKGSDVKGYSEIDNKDKTLKIVNSGEEDKIINIENIFDEVYKRYLETGKLEFTKEELTFEVENYKIIFQNISLMNPEYTGELSINNYYNIDGYLLIK